MEKKLELYRYPFYPIHRALSYLPGDILIDIKGNCYEIDYDFLPIKVMNSVLTEKENILDLTKFQFYKLFKVLTNKELISKGYTVYA